MKHLTCPVCEKTLRYLPEERRLLCEQGHSFDQARQGYFNLLLSQQKKSKQPGDTPDMVAARTEFLNAGYYAPITATAARLIQSHSSEVVQNYCDLACGEGYYTHALHTVFAQAGSTISTGIDISTPAIKAAARRNKALQWLVASMVNAPIESASQDAVTCLFCRLDTAEALRLLRPEGLLLIVESGPQHLDGLRRALYSEIHEKPLTQAEAIDGAELLAQEQLSESLDIQSGRDISNLLRMTPHFWRATDAAKQGILELKHLQTHIDVHFRLYRKNS